MNDRQSNLRGAALMTISMAGFTINDSFLKALSDELPLFQAIGLRSVGSILLMVLLAQATGTLRLSVPPADRLPMLLRSLCEAGAAFAFLGALFHMDFANAQAIGQVTPLVVAFAASIWLGEKLTAVRLIALAVGLVGVLLIVQPGGSGFNIWSLSVMASVVMVVVRDLLTRKMSSDIPTLAIALYGAIAVGILSWSCALYQGFAPVTLKATAQMGGSAAFLVIGYFTAIAAMRVGEVSFVAPFRYTSMVFSLLIGWLVFSQFPDNLTLTGVAIVIAAGLYCLAFDRGTIPTPPPREPEGIAP